MAKRAEAMDFERAAHLRDLSEALAKTIKKNRRFVRALPENNTDQSDVLRELQKKLELADIPNVIECFDISHVSGTFVVASMVRFVGGKPDKKGYRRFKIKSFVGNDDFRAMQEVVNRRYARLAAEGREFPDLVVVDGGLGQVTSAKKSFLLLDLDSVPLIGLAKREETVVFPDERDELKMSVHDPALRLLQRVRDEAHRFANRFNADLRSKKIKESILDDFAGLGEVKRASLMQKFGNLEKIRKAGVEELCEVEGIGPKLADRLYHFLHQEVKS
jgi:excinuclease ABC subunit C